MEHQIVIVLGLGGLEELALRLDLTDVLDSRLRLRGWLGDLGKRTRFGHLRCRLIVLEICTELVLRLDVLLLDSCGSSALFKGKLLIVLVVFNEHLGPVSHLRGRIHHIPASYRLAHLLDFQV